MLLSDLSSTPVLFLVPLFPVFLYLYTGSWCRIQLLWLDMYCSFIIYPVVKVNVANNRWHQMLHSSFVVTCIHLHVSIWVLNEFYGSSCILSLLVCCYLFDKLFSIDVYVVVGAYLTHVCMFIFSWQIGSSFWVADSRRFSYTFCTFQHLYFSVKLINSDILLQSLYISLCDCQGQSRYFTDKLVPGIWQGVWLNQCRNFNKSVNIRSFL